MALATRQPSTAAASSHAAIVPINGWPEANLKARKPAGTDQASTQATVRAGTKARASTRAWAASATATGIRTTEKIQLRSWLPAAAKTTTPQRATEAVAPMVRRLWTTETIP